jgi:hypothetical protein
MGDLPALCVRPGSKPVPSAHIATMAETAPKLTDLVLATRTITEQGTWCPFQAEGTILGQHFYFRFRTDYASLTVGESDVVVISNVTGDPLAGSLSTDEFEKLFRKLLKRYLKSLKF